MAWAAVAAVATVASAVVSGVAAIQQGNAARSANNAQAAQQVVQAQAQVVQAQAHVDQGAATRQQAEIDAENTELAAKQDQILRLDDLGRTVGAIRATVIGRGLDLNSPSATALVDTARGYADQDRDNALYNAMQDAANFRLYGRVAQKQSGDAARISILGGQSSMQAAEAYRSSGRAASTAGYLGAAGSLFKAASGVSSLYR